MIKEIYKINSDGIYEDVYLANIAENTYYHGEEWLVIDFEYVETQPPNAKVVKWENGEWVVIEEYPTERQEPQPTQEDYLIDLDFRLSLVELGLI